MALQTVGILGAGKMGITVAQLARHAGFEVLVAGSGSPDKIALTVATLAPGAKALTATEVARRSDVVILALPLRYYKNLDITALAGKLVIDAMNHWWEVDGPREDIVALKLSTSEAVQAHLSKSRVVKALSHMGYHHLHDEARPKGAVGRKAIAVAGDNSADVDAVAELINEFGFNPLPIGRLKQGVFLEPGNPAFGANVSLTELKRLLDAS